MSSPQALLLLLGCMHVRLTNTTNPSSFSISVRSSRTYNGRPSTSRPHSSSIALLASSAVSNVTRLACRTGGSEGERGKKPGRETLSDEGREIAHFLAISSLLPENPQSHLRPPLGAARVTMCLDFDAQHTTGCLHDGCQTVCGGAP